MITAADSNSSSTTSTIWTDVETANKQSKVNNDNSKCALSEGGKVNLNKGSLIRNNSVKYFREYKQ